MPVHTGECPSVCPHGLILAAKESECIVYPDREAGSLPNDGERSTLLSLC